MLEKNPSNEEMQDLLGVEKFNAWQAVCSLVDSLYEMDIFWNSGGKNWVYEYKYRRGGKTLCSLYAKDNWFGIMIIFGKVEREKFENEKDTYSSIIQGIYDSSTTYHDGKWMMIELCESTDRSKAIEMIKTKGRTDFLAFMTERNWVCFKTKDSFFNKRFGKKVNE